MAELLGEYPTPAFRYGDAAFCEVRGEVVITSLSDSPIPWPVGKRPGQRARALVIYAGLAEAVRRESSASICFHWGVTAQTVSKWRKAMGVGQMTKGTTRLKSETARESPGVAQALKLAVAKSGDPERRRKISEARKGKPRPAHVVEAVRKAHAGKPLSEEARKKLSEAHKRRGTRPPKAGRPWTEREESYLGRVPDKLLAQRFDRKESAVKARRQLLRIEEWSVWD